MVAKKKIEGFTTQDLTTMLSISLSKVMAWMPPENRSKAICIPDPRDPTKLCAIHNGPDGIILLIGEGYQEFVEELLCEDCIASLVPYSVIFTGFDLDTGEFDENTFVGLYGAHQEEFEIDFLEDEQDKVEDAKKRTLN